MGYVRKYISQSSFAQHRDGGMSISHKKASKIPGKHQQKLVAESVWRRIPSAQIMEADYAQHAYVAHHTHLIHHAHHVHLINLVCLAHQAYLVHCAHLGMISTVAK